MWWPTDNTPLSSNKKGFSHSSTYVFDETSSSAESFWNDLDVRSDVLADISTRSKSVCWYEGSFDRIQMLDNCTLFPLGVQSPLCFDELCIAKLMHKQTYSVFGRIDVYSVPKYLTVSLGGSLDMDCVLLAPELFKVCRPWINPGIMKLTSTDDVIGYKELPIGRVKAHWFPLFVLSFSRNASSKEPGNLVLFDWLSVNKSFMTNSEKGLFLFSLKT